MELRKLLSHERADDLGLSEGNTRDPDRREASPSLSGVEKHGMQLKLMCEWGR